MAKKIAIVTSHPIQYYAPLFRLLAKKVELKVFYTWGKEALVKFDPGFGKKVEWDIPLLDGYEYQYLNNVSTDPGSHHFKGIINPSITTEISDYNPDAIMVIGWGYDSHLKVLRYFKGKKSLYFRGDSTLLDNNNEGILGRLKRLLRRIFLAWVYSHVDKAFYVGEESKLYFKWALLKETQLVFSPHSIDNSRYEIDHTEKANELRNSLSISNSDRVILFAGKFENKKNPLLLLNAFINASTHSLHLLFVGNGELELKLKQVAKESSKVLFVHFLDFQNQSMMPIWYHMTDVFCLPSKGPAETWGLAVNEAMASGKAIIVSDKVGCAKDLVKKNSNGWIFKSENVLELQQIIENLPDKNRLKELGLGSKKIIQNWTIDITAQKMINEWEAL